MSDDDLKKVGPDQAGSRGTNDEDFGFEVNSSISGFSVDGETKKVVDVRETDNRAGRIALDEAMVKEKAGPVDTLSDSEESYDAFGGVEEGGGDKETEVSSLKGGESEKSGGADSSLNEVSASNEVGEEGTGQVGQEGNLKEGQGGQYTGIYDGQASGNEGDAVEAGGDEGDVQESAGQALESDGGDNAPVAPVREGGGEKKPSSKEGEGDEVGGGSKSDVDKTDVDKTKNVGAGGEGDGSERKDDSVVAGGSKGKDLGADVDENVVDRKKDNTQTSQTGGQGDALQSDEGGKVGDRRSGQVGSPASGDTVGGDQKTDVGVDGKRGSESNEPKKGGKESDKSSKGGSGKGQERNGLRENEKGSGQQGKETSEQRGVKGEGKEEPKATRQGPHNEASRVGGKPTDGGPSAAGGVVNKALDKIDPTGGGVKAVSDALKVAKGLSSGDGGVGQQIKDVAKETAAAAVGTVTTAVTGVPLAGQVAGKLTRASMPLVKKVAVVLIVLFIYFVSLFFIIAVGAVASFFGDEDSSSGSTASQRVSGIDYNTPESSYETTMPLPFGARIFGSNGGDQFVTTKFQTFSGAKRVDAVGAWLGGIFFRGEKENEKQSFFLPPLLGTYNRDSETGYCPNGAVGGECSYRFDTKYPQYALKYNLNTLMTSGDYLDSSSYVIDAFKLAGINITFPTGLASDPKDKSGIIYGSTSWLYHWFRNDNEYKKFKELDKITDIMTPEIDRTFLEPNWAPAPGDVAFTEITNSKIAGVNPDPKAIYPNKEYFNDETVKENEIPNHSEIVENVFYYDYKRTSFSTGEGMDLPLSGAIGKAIESKDICCEWEGRDDCWRWNGDKDGCIEQTGCNWNDGDRKCRGDRRCKQWDRVDTKVVVYRELLPFNYTCGDPQSYRGNINTDPMIFGRDWGNMSASWCWNESWHYNHPDGKPHVLIMHESSNSFSGCRLLDTSEKCNTSPLCKWESGKCVDNAKVGKSSMLGYYPALCTANGKDYCNGTSFSCGSSGGDWMPYAERINEEGFATCFVTKDDTPEYCGKDKHCDTASQAIPGDKTVSEIRGYILKPGYPQTRTKRVCVGTASEGNYEYTYREYEPSNVRNEECPDKEKGCGDPQPIVVKSGFCGDPNKDYSWCTGLGSSTKESMWYGRMCVWNILKATKMKVYTVGETPRVDIERNEDQFHEVPVNGLGNIILSPFTKIHLSGTIVDGTNGNGVSVNMTEWDGKNPFDAKDLGIGGVSDGKYSDSAFKEKFRVERLDTSIIPSMNFIANVDPLLHQIYVNDSGAKFHCLRSQKRDQVYGEVAFFDNKKLDSSATRSGASFTQIDRNQFGSIFGVSSSVINDFRYNTGGPNKLNAPKETDLEIPLTRPLDTSQATIVSKERNLHVLEFSWPTWNTGSWWTTQMNCGSHLMFDTQDRYTECSTDGLWRQDYPKIVSVQSNGKDMELVARGWGKIMPTEAGLLKGGTPYGRSDSSLGMLSNNSVPDNGYPLNIVYNPFLFSFGRIFGQQTSGDCSEYERRIAGLYSNYGEYPNPGTPPANNVDWSHPIPGVNVHYGFMCHENVSYYSVCYPHRGADLGSEGKPIYAPCSGIVLLPVRNGRLYIKCDGMTSNGGAVLVRTYHSKLAPGIVAGTRVVSGKTVIGYVSSYSASGVEGSFGAHLHLEIMMDGQAYDPIKVIPGLSGSSCASQYLEVPPLECMSCTYSTPIKTPWTPNPEGVPVQGGGGSSSEIPFCSVPAWDPFTPECFKRCLGSGILLECAEPAKEDDFCSGNLIDGSFEGDFLEENMAINLPAGWKSWYQDGGSPCGDYQQTPIDGNNATVCRRPEWSQYKPVGSICQEGFLTHGAKALKIFSDFGSMNGGACFELRSAGCGEINVGFNVSVKWPRVKWGDIDVYIGTSDSVPGSGVEDWKVVNWGIKKTFHYWEADSSGAIRSSISGRLPYAKYLCIRANNQYAGVGIDTFWDAGFANCSECTLPQNSQSNGPKCGYVSDYSPETYSSTVLLNKECRVPDEELIVCQNTSMKDLESCSGLSEEEVFQKIKEQIHKHEGSPVSVNFDQIRNLCASYTKNDSKGTGMNRVKQLSTEEFKSESSIDCWVALGKYQIMSFNWKNWCEAEMGVGNEICQDWRNYISYGQFTVSEEIQDRIADRKMRNILKSVPSDWMFGKWAWLVKWWYSGFSSTAWYYRQGKDCVYPSACEYAASVIKNVYNEICA